MLGALGCGLSTRDGRRAGRFRCAFRSLIVWAPPLLLLVASVASKKPGVDAGPGAWLLFGMALVLVVAYPLIALVSPSRGPQDHLAGTVLVPK